MSTKPMTGLEKVAVLLKSLPDAVADKVLRLLDPQQAGKVRSELTKLSADADLQDKLKHVLDEAASMLEAPAPPKQDQPAKAPGTAAAPAKNAESAAKPGDATAKPATPADASQIDIRIDGLTDPKAAPAAPGPDANPMAALDELPPELLAAAMDCENARTIALLMNAMEIERAGQIFKRLSSVKRREVSLRFTDTTTVADELIKRIAQGVLKKCQALRSAAPGANEQGRRENRMAALLRGLERTERMEMLTALQEADAELTGRVKALLYQFEDVLRMENTSVQKLLSEVDVKSLALALRGAPKDIEEKILTNLSKRAQESLKEEIGLTGTVQSAKIKQAQQTLVEAIQALDQRGELVMME